MRPLTNRDIAEAQGCHPESHFFIAIASTVVKPGVGIEDCVFGIRYLLLVTRAPFPPDALIACAILRYAA